MLKVKIENAVGKALAHDHTRIVKNLTKGRHFKRGHIVQNEDIPMLLAMGKKHIYVLENEENNSMIMHEEEAAYFMKNLFINMGDGVYADEVSEGKINLKADKEGVFYIDSDFLQQINEIDDIIVASVFKHKIVKKDDIVLSFRAIPLYIESEKIQTLAKLCHNYLSSADKEKKFFSVQAFHKLKTALIYTGSEIYNSLINNDFEKVMKEKTSQFDLPIIYEKICDDDEEMICEAIREAKKIEAQLIILTGGMSVDPDDLTADCIKKESDNFIRYGFPVIPGAMAALAYDKNCCIIGVPASALFMPTTVFDLILPRILCGEKLSKKDICSYAHGGLISKMMHKKCC